MEEEEQNALELEAREAFNETYSKEYLEYLYKKSSDIDLVELLWAGFVNGYCCE